MGRKKKEEKDVPIERVKVGVNIRNKKGLSIAEEKFIDKYLETNNGTQSAIYAGYSPKTAVVKGSQLLTRIKVQEEIKRRREKMEKKSIATSEQVLEFLTRAMNGEIKDQFGLDAPLSERIKAATELAKRTVDIDNRSKGTADNVVDININWKRDEDEQN